MAITFDEASETVNKSRTNPFDQLSKFGRTVNNSANMDTLLALRQEQEDLFQLEEAKRVSAGDPFRNWYSSTSNIDTVDQRRLRIEALQAKLVDPLVNSLVFSLASLQKIDLPPSAAQIVASTIENIGENLLLIPTFEKPERDGDFAKTIDLEVDSPESIWMTVFPEAITEIETRPWLLLVDAFLACVQYKESTGAKLNQFDAILGVQAILRSAEESGRVLELTPGSHLYEAMAFDPAIN